MPPSSATPAAPAARVASTARRAAASTKLKRFEGAGASAAGAGAGAAAGASTGGFGRRSGVGEPEEPVAVASGVTGEPTAVAFRAGAAGEARCPAAAGAEAGASRSAKLRPTESILGMLTMCSRETRLARVRGAPPPSMAEAVVEAVVEAAARSRASDLGPALALAHAAVGQTAALAECGLGGGRRGVWQGERPWQKRTAAPARCGHWATEGLRGSLRVCAVAVAALRQSAWSGPGPRPCASCGQTWAWACACACASCGLGLGRGPAPHVRPGQQASCGATRTALRTLLRGEGGSVARGEGSAVASCSSLLRASSSSPRLRVARLRS